ncbi:beta-galactosidase-like [Lutzomyia longipalpis]|uniref:beta-galactosidase-like n=1 Tax=Lutzomyia longipalpis TaxID=7200 RepID=UPI002484032D|nr:beta-galactosidase-like [Lutzomyia longipalpis]
MLKIFEFFVILLYFGALSVNSQLILESNVQRAVVEETFSHGRKFEVDYENDTFLLDGKPFRYISGSFHYFRAPRENWRQKLRTMRATGLNAVSTYVEWSLHNPKDNDQYVWSGMADLEHFLDLAVQEDLLVILRPGPYICAERDMGGFPYWLLTKYPKIQLRTFDSDYLREVEKWYGVLMPKMQPYLYGNGGPIIMVQVENEYGSFKACDANYMKWLRDETLKYIQDKALLFTTDGPGMLACGSVENVFATIDFGPSKTISGYWEKLRKFRPRGPLVNSEYYPGWLTHWQEGMQRVDTEKVVKTLDDMLHDNASVNFYMFFGGTNFGFTAGANNGGIGSYQADVTSYDYDAPMTEAGDATPKLFAIRDTISRHVVMPGVAVPDPSPKLNYGKVYLTPRQNLLSRHTRRSICRGSVESRTPVSFEELDQNSGLVLYERDLPPLRRDPSALMIEKLHDRAIVYIDRQFVGILSRENKIDTLSINWANWPGQKLQILVESQGRINYDIANDFKGILGSITLDYSILFNWTITGCPLENIEDIEVHTRERSPFYRENLLREGATKCTVRNGPVFFRGEFALTPEQLMDTYLDPTGWGKGVAFLNGVNLGRYWPTVGPQITLYVPKEFLLAGTNSLILLEYERCPEERSIELVATPKLDGYQ